MQSFNICGRYVTIARAIINGKKEYYVSLMPCKERLDSMNKVFNMILADKRMSDYEANHKEIKCICSPYQLALGI